MPPLPVITNCSRVALNYVSADALTAVNVIHIVGLLDPSDLADTILSAIPTTGSAMWAPMSSGARLNSMDILPLDGTTSTYHREIVPEAWHYGQGGGPYTPALAALVRLGTLIRGRSYRGRVYIPFVGEGVAGSGLLDAGARDDCEVGWDTFRTNLVNDQCLLSVASYRHRTAEMVDRVSVPAKLATQRRRQDRVS